MKVNEIEELLARYYDGETNEAEEQELKQFFSEEKTPAHLLAEKEFFMQLSVQAEATVPTDLENKLAQLIDNWEGSERRSMKVRKQHHIFRMQWIGSIAAGILILFSVGLYLYKPYLSLTPQDTCASPEEAYAEAQKALVLFSTKLNQGINHMETIQTTAGKMQENVNEQLNRIKNIKQ